MSIRKISKSFFRSGFRGWIQGPLAILRPRPGKVNTKVYQPYVELLIAQPEVVAKTLQSTLETVITQPNVVAKAGIPVVTTTIIYSE